MPDATYVKRGHVYGKFRLPNKQYVTVNKSGPTTVVVRFQLLRNPGRPEDGYLHDCEEFYCRERPSVLIRSLDVFLSDYTDSALLAGN